MVQTAFQHQKKVFTYNRIDNLTWLLTLYTELLHLVSVLTSL